MNNQAYDDNDLEAYFRALVSAYVNFPDNLKLEFKRANDLRGTWALILEPDVGDYAIVAGSKGRNFNALRAVATVIGKRKRMEVELLLEGPSKDDDRFIRRQLPYRVNPQWTPAVVKDLVARSLRLAGMPHVKLNLRKNTTVDSVNPFNDQTFYWFGGMKTEEETGFVFALGQLMESMGIAQGQRLTPRPAQERALEKTA